MLALHRTGTPLAATLPDLTPAQHDFLVAGLADQERREGDAMRKLSEKHQR